MIFLSLVVVLAVVYWLGSPRFIQYDGWFTWLVKRLQSIPGVAAVPLLPMVLALFLPMLVLVIAIVIVAKFASTASLFCIYVPVLLYSLGRGDFVADVNEYIAAANKGDNVAATQLVDQLRGNAVADPQSADVSDWQALHTEALKVMSYRGFERTFAVLFWFVIAGPVGALLYRLSILYREVSETGGDDARIASKWLWLLEFPAVRLMGVTWAFVGNFDSCPLRSSLLDTDSSSMKVLNNCLRGALGATTECPATMKEPSPDAEANTEALDEESQDIIEDLTGAVITTHSEPAYSFALVKASMPLYSRSLLFWVCAIAFATLFIA